MDAHKITVEVKKMEYTKGQVVYSISGRDKTMPFIVIAEEGDYLYLADGKLRTLEHPKKKKKKHVQKSNIICYNVKDALESEAYLLNADISKALKSLAGNS